MLQLLAGGEIAIEDLLLDGGGGGGAAETATGSSGEIAASTSDRGGGGAGAEPGWPRVFHCDLNEDVELPLLAEPRLGAEQVGGLYAGEEVTAVGQQGDWLHVRLYEYDEEEDYEEKDDQDDVSSVVWAGSLGVGWTGRPAYVGCRWPVGVFSVGLDRRRPWWGGCHVTVFAAAFVRRHLPCLVLSCRLKRQASVVRPNDPGLTAALSSSISSAGIKGGDG